MTLRPLSIGEILDGSFTLYRRHFLVFYTTALTFLSPLIMLALLLPGAITVVELPCYILASTALIWDSSEAALGRRPGLAEGLRVAVRRFFRVLLAILAMTVLIVLGFFALIIPGLILFIRYFAVQQVVTLEKAPHFLKRSAALAEGSWGKVFVVFLISGIIAALPAAAVGASTGLYSVGSNEPPSPHAEALHALVASLTMPFSMAAMTLLYYDQRVRKEGLDVAMAASALGELVVPRETPGASPGA